MKVILFGATDPLGTALINTLLGQKHTVVAYGRNVLQKITPLDDLELVQASYFDEHEIAKAIGGCDAVITAISAGNHLNDVTLSLGIKKITAEMEKAGINRIVALGGYSILEDENGKMLFEKEDFPEAEKASAEEYFKAFQTLNASGLNWTMVCPAVIQNLPETGLYQVSVNKLVAGIHSITTADLSAFMVNELSANQYLKWRVSISN